MTEQTNGDTLSRRLSAHLDKSMPDPTILTTQQLLRELATLREIIETRLDGGDKAVKLLQDSADKLPTFVGEQISHLKELHGEKFNSVQTQFAERDTRDERSSKDNKTAIDAALQAAKDNVSEQNKSSALAISKSEGSTTKQIDQIGTLIANLTKTMDDKINDIKSRLDRGTGNTEGIKDTKDDHKSWIAVAISITAVILTAIIGVAHLIK